MNDQIRKQDNEIEKDPALLWAIADYPAKYVSGCKRHERAPGVSITSDMHIRPSQTNTFNVIESNHIIF